MLRDPPSIIKTVSARDVRPGTKHIALWLRDQPWPNRGVALPAALDIPRQRGPSGMRMAAAQAAISARCHPGLAHGCGLCRAPLPGSTARLRSAALPGSRSPGPKAKGAPSAVLSAAAEPAHPGFWGTMPLFRWAPALGAWAAVPVVPRCGVQGTVRVPVRVRRASEAGGGCLDYESLELGRGGGIGKGSKGLFLLLKPSAKGLALSYTSRCVLCLSVSQPVVSVLPGVEGGRGEGDPWIEAWRRPARAL